MCVVSDISHRYEIEVNILENEIKTNILDSTTFVILFYNVLLGRFHSKIKLVLVTLE